MAALETDTLTSEGQTILVVDDLSLIRERTRWALLHAGYQVIEAGDGREAVDMYRSHRPAAVLMDMTMPVMSGIEALEEIRAFDPDAQVTMLTGHSESTLVYSAIGSGAVDYVVKPFTNARLLASVEKMLGHLSVRQAS